MRERTKFETLAENAPFGMALISRKGRFTYINAGFSALFGYSLSEIPDGRTWCRKVYPDTAYRHQADCTLGGGYAGRRPGRAETPGLYGYLQGTAPGKWSGSSSPYCSQGIT